MAVKAKCPEKEKQEGEDPACWKGVCPSCYLPGKRARTSLSLGVLQHLFTFAKTSEAAVVMKAMSALHWTEDDFKLLNGLVEIED